jgi:5S rRNA maturation endonuclease (ribonuclease M5)/archaellum biogenesis ATPase FlaH
MTDDLEAIKSDQRLVKLYSQYTKLKKEGDRYTGLCPIHREKNQSFAVWGKDMMWTCFSGGCGNGNIFQFVQKMDNTDFKGALAKVKDFLGQNQWESQKERVEQTFRAVAETNKTFKVFEYSAYSKYIENLKSSKDGQAWLASRGITLETAVKLHWGYRQGNQAGEKNAEWADKGWICMPCLRDNKVVSIKYRSIASKVFTKQAGMETVLHGLESIDLFDDIYLVEGEVDRASLEQYGFKAVSLPSASTNVTPEMKDQLMRANRVILAGDSDEVGSAAMDKLWRDLSERTFMLRWPGDCKDANDLLRQDPSKFKEKVEELTQQALKQPAPDLYSLAEVMRSSSEFSLEQNPNRLRFPWPSVDKMAILLPGSVLAVYATSTGMGKTTWTHQLALYNAMKFAKSVVNYQCEMMPEELGVMTAAQLLRKNRNFLSKEDQIEAAQQLDGVSYHIGSNPHLSSATEVLDLIEAAIRRFGADLVVLDHFHHVCADLTNENAVQSMAAQRIKQMAEQYKCIFISVGQPRKASSNSKGKIPHISDAKGSEAYTSKANAVFALHRALNKNADDGPQNDMYESKMLVQAQKTRSKGTGAAEAYLTSFGEFACFEEIDYAHSDGE